MKLLKNHLVTGGIVGLYDDTKAKTAKFEIKLTAEAATEHAAAAKLAADLATISRSIAELAEGMLIQDTKRELTETLVRDKEAKRREFRERLKSSKREVDNPGKDTYPVGSGTE